MGENRNSEKKESSIPILPFPLEDEEKVFFEGDVSRSLPFRITPYISQQIIDLDSRELRLQFVPRATEYLERSYESRDPLSESEFSPVPRLIHRYKNRVLIQVTGQCAAYCRHCFRRKLTGENTGHISPEEIGAIADWLSTRDEIKEILFSGGDPLTLADDELQYMLSVFRELKPERIFRIATRIPVVLPGRITGDLKTLLKKCAPVWCVVQINHPVELSSRTQSALALLVDAGIPVVSQTVLLKGINNSADTLAELFNRLLVLGIKPYYLFQGDLASGTSHFRVPLKEGLDIVRRLRSRVSGLAMPVYAVDLPGGGGKVPLTESSIIGETESSYLFRSAENTVHSYPKE